MTQIYNSAAQFKDEAAEGLVAAYARYLEAVPNASGVIRRGDPASKRVGVVIGGGSGHYPLSGGLVGDGIATAAVLGDVFTSPSTEQVYRVASAANGGAGVFLSYGNYTGDVINFDAAQARLRAEGVDCRTVLVTDDIASGPADQTTVRRGIAGCVFVYKAAGAAAARGDALPEVERVARKVNDRTRTLGVAFKGCTLPGQRQPLFEMSSGLMGIGLGIHGEPGIENVPRMPAHDLAGLLVEAVLRERPDRSADRAAVLLNGLGAVKYEELFVLWRSVLPALEAAGVQVVLPEVGEFVTSLDMAGCSLTVSWLDEETERLWAAPVDAPAFRRGLWNAPAREPRQASSTHVIEPRESDSSPRPKHGPDRGAGVAREAFARMLETVVAHEAELSRIDAVAGDGDHGTGMTRGLRAARSAADAADGGFGSILRAAGGAWADKAGGTSGALWGVLLQGIASTVGDEQVVPQTLAAGVRRGLADVQAVGHAAPGDKTFVDALAPFTTALESGLDEGMSLAQAWRAAADIAHAAALDTAPLRPRLGRARPLADRSVGTPDPGAVSFALCARAAADVLAEHEALCARTGGG